MEVENNNQSQEGVAAARDASAIVKPPHVLAADAAIEALQTMPLTMEQRLKFDLERVATMTFAADRQHKVAARVQEYQRIGLECIRHYSIDGFDRECSGFWRDISELARPIPPPTFADNLSAHIPGMNNLGWLGSECEALAHYAAGGANGSDRIVSYTVNHAVLASGRTVTRVQIREGLRPAWQSAERWEQTPVFQAMKRAHDAAVAGQQRWQANELRANVVSAGPSHLIGKHPAEAAASK
jgi:hypothetical protein